jgi:hypothetical protein
MHPVQTALSDAALAIGMSLSAMSALRHYGLAPNAGYPRGQVGKTGSRGRRGKAGRSLLLSLRMQRRFFFRVRLLDDFRNSVKCTLVGDHPRHLFVAADLGV